MKLILHDLSPSQAELLGLHDLPAADYMIVDSHGDNHYCTGCFGCWLKTPGKCVIKDAYTTMGQRLSQMDEFLIISRAAFGGYSSAVKNVLDRSISYVQPFFVKRNGEMHHKERYHNHLVFSAIFYGEMTEAEKATARNFVQANALNLNGSIKEVQFFDSMEAIGRDLL